MYRPIAYFIVGILIGIDGVCNMENGDTFISSRLPETKFFYRKQNANGNLIQSQPYSWTSEILNSNERIFNKVKRSKFQPYLEKRKKNFETNDIETDQDVELKLSYLLQMLQKYPSDEILPVVYVDNQQPDLSTEMEIDTLSKRSGRYYQRYPWKRQSTRSRTYEAETRYFCIPSRDDVFKLLVGLHENRNGNQQQTINFCNIRRPAKAIFTNIRFLG